MARDEGTGNNTEALSVCLKDGIMSNKWKNTGETSTESVAEGVVLTVTEKKVELSPNSDIEGILNRVAEMQTGTATLHELIEKMSTAEVDAKGMRRKIESMPDKDLSVAMLALMEDKLKEIEANATDKAKQAVALQLSTIEAFMDSIDERIGAIRTKNGIALDTPVVGGKKASSAVNGIPKGANITMATYQNEIPDELKKAFNMRAELLSDKIHVHVRGTGHEAGTPFLSNIFKWK